MNLKIWIARVLPPLVLGCGLMAIYLATMAPGLTWANDGADGGDLIAAAATGGIPHPTGYPMYMLVARLFQALPLGTLAFRTNLLSACATIGAALLVYVVTKRAFASSAQQPAVLGGLAAGFALGLAPLIWSQAVITEVYALNLFFIAWLLYLLTAEAPRSRLQNRFAGLVQGLAVGNQILAVLLIPATLSVLALKRGYAGSRTWREWYWDRAALRDAGLGLLAGLCSYAVLPIRALSHPALNWGDASRPEGFWWLVSGRLYQPELLQFSPTVLWEHVQGWARLTLQQFGVVGLAIALLGLILYFRPSRLYLLTIWIALVFTLFSVQYNVVDSRVYLLPVYLAFSVWIGLGVGNGIAAFCRRSGAAIWVAGIACLAYLSVLAVQRWPLVDASQDGTAEAFGRNIMSAAPASAILFAQGDQTVFSLWYFHYALRERTDVVVIADDLLPFDWYRDNLRHTYPGLVVPALTEQPWVTAIRQSNPGRPACYPYDSEPILNCQ